MEDLNELLKQTVTAAEDGGEASEMWIRRGKKSHQELELAQSSTSDNEEIDRKNKQRRQEDHTTAAFNATTSTKHYNHIFDAVEMRHQIEESRRKDAKQLNAQNAMASAVSAQYSARMAHNIIQYVFDHELGGKQNNKINAMGSTCYNAYQYSCVDFALAGRSADVNDVLREHHGATAVERGFAMIRADIAVERATRSHVSFYKLQHIVSNNLSNNAEVLTTTHSGKSGVNRYGSSVHWSKLPEDVIEYRRSLQPCSIAFDLDGGWTGMQSGSSAQLPIELRRRIKSVILAGLQGKSYIPQAEYAHLQPSTQNGSNGVVMERKDMTNVVNNEKQEKQEHLQTRKDATVSDPAMVLFVQSNNSPDRKNKCDELKDINTGKTASNRDANVYDNKHDDEFDIDAFLQASSSSSSSSESESEQEESVQQYHLL